MQGEQYLAVSLKALHKFTVQYIGLPDKIKQYYFLGDRKGYFCTYVRET
jgi:hypothetical protein